MGTKALKMFMKIVIGVGIPTLLAVGYGGWQLYRNPAVAKMLEVNEQAARQTGLTIVVTVAITLILMALTYLGY